MDGETAPATAERITADFARQLPVIRAVLVCDLLATYEMDPAAKSYLEIVLGYPGFVAIVYHRLAHALYRLGATLSARLIANIAPFEDGNRHTSGRRDGAGLFCDHGTGVVIGETAIVGERVKLYQAVTLGAQTEDHRTPSLPSLPYKITLNHLRSLLI